MAIDHAGIALIPAYLHRTRLWHTIIKETDDLLQNNVPAEDQARVRSSSLELRKSKVTEPRTRF